MKRKAFTINMSRKRISRQRMITLCLTGIVEKFSDILKTPRVSGMSLSENANLDN
jgi:hypothetical protein